MRKEEHWELWLYIAGQTPKSMLALENITKYGEEHFKERYTLKVVDLFKSPQLAEADEIFAIPTLVRKIPTPVRKLIGDLSDKEKVLAGLNIRLIRIPDGN